MRAVLLATLTLAALTVGCAEKPLEHDEYPGTNQDIDLRAGEYTAGAGHEALALSTPRVVTLQGIPDRPVVETPMQVHPVNPGVTPVAPSRLVTMLPAPPKGWTAEEANAIELATPQGLLTEGQRSYWSGKITPAGGTADGGDTHSSIDVTVIDRGQTGPAVVELASVAADERRGVEAKPVTVEGFSGQEFVAGPGLRQLDLDVTDRFLVRVRGGNVTFEDLRAWAAKVPLKDLAGLK